MSHQGSEHCLFVHSCGFLKRRAAFDAYPVVRGHVSEPGTNKRLHNEFSLGITHLNGLIYTHAIEERGVLFMSCCARDGWPARSHG